MRIRMKDLNKLKFLSQQIIFCKNIMNTRFYRVICKKLFNIVEKENNNKILGLGHTNRLHESKHSKVQVNNYFMLISLNSPGFKLPSSYLPYLILIKRFTFREKYSKIFLISRFFPSVNITSNHEFVEPSEINLIDFGL